MSAPGTSLLTSSAAALVFSMLLQMSTLDHVMPCLPLKSAIHSVLLVLQWPKTWSKVAWVAVWITQPLTEFFWPAEYTCNSQMCHNIWLEKYQPAGHGHPGAPPHHVEHRLLPDARVAPSDHHSLAVHPRTARKILVQWLSDKRSHHVSWSHNVNDSHTHTFHPMSDILSDRTAYFDLIWGVI